MKEYFKSWGKFEIIWLSVFTILGIGLSIYWQESLIGFVAFLTGIICVVLAAKGSIWNYMFGVVNCVAYAYVSYHSKLYGEVMLNLLYFLPMQFIGYFAWRKSIDENKEVIKKKLSLKNILLVLSITFVCILLYQQILIFLSGNLTLLDSITTIVSVIAAILMNLRYREQWVLWTIVNVISVIMWWLVRDNMIMALLFFAYLLNSIYGYIKWSKD